jgi:hypothetical protein
METPSTSPERNTFQKQNYILRQLEAGKSLDDPRVSGMIKWYDSWNELDQKRLQDPEWRENNLEWDLRTTDWIVEKVRNDKIYAQNLYAALCNNDFAKDVFKVLKEEYWGCSWRSAGGIIANMRGEGDYIDWYCSGMRNDSLEEDGSNPTNPDIRGEGVVTDEVRSDLERLGWIVIFNGENGNE